MIEEVTEYETVESTTTQYVSDLSGNVIDEDEVVEMHANPRLSRIGTESDGVLHLSAEEFVELADEDIDPNSLTPSSELSPISIEKLNPEVVERPWLNLDVDGHFGMLLVAAFMFINAYLVTESYGKVIAEMFAIISLAVGALVILGMIYAWPTE